MEKLKKFLILPLIFFACIIAGGFLVGCNSNGCTCEAVVECDHQCDQQQYMWLELTMDNYLNFLTFNGGSFGGLSGLMYMDVNGTASNTYSSDEYIFNLNISGAGRPAHDYWGGSDRANSFVITSITGYVRLPADVYTQFK